MKRTCKARWRDLERGSVAIEAAFVLLILVTFFSLPSIFWAFFFYKYSAAQKAVHDAALYLATAPRLEMTSSGPDGNPAALGVATRIMSKEMTWLNTSDIGIVCNYRQVSELVVPKPCSTANNQDSKQTLVQLSVSIDMAYVDQFTGMDSGMRISPYAIVPYVGN